MIDDPKMLAEECLAYSIKKGFARTTWDTLAIRLACIYREIDELVEAAELEDVDAADRAAKEELADVAGYALVVLVDLNNQDWNLRTSLHAPMPAGKFTSADTMVRPLRDYNGMALENWKLGEQFHWNVINALQHLVTACAVLSRKLFSCSLDVLVLSNLQAKADREILHGGKDPRA